MKKRKLNSKNPKYMDKSLLKEPKIKKKVHNCTTHNGVKVYAIWYEQKQTTQRFHVIYDDCLYRVSDIDNWHGNWKNNIIYEVKVVVAGSRCRAN